MKSSDGRRRGAGVLAAWLVVALAAAGIAATRSRVAGQFHELRTTADVYPFAAPEQMVVASLGYRAALADAIYAHVLVSYGLHFQEKRRFEFVGDYLDTMNALDPAFREPYRFADTLLVMSSEAPRLEHYQKAREILMRGVANRPYDSELWLTLGQFLAFLARPYLPPDLQQAWSTEGARALARACELASKNEAVPYHCITAASLFEKAGEREAAIESLRRLLAVSDDPEIQRRALGYLRARLSEREEERMQRRKELFRGVWKSDLPFIGKDMALVVGPKTATARCAGITGAEDAECVTSWRDWARLADPVTD